MLWDIGIELGETAVRMATREKGLAFAAPSWGAARKGALIAIGDEARQMLGRTPPGVTLSRPLEHGSIADARLTAQWLTRLLEPFVGGAKVNRPSVVFLDGGRLAPGEREMLIDTARELGAGTCGFLEEAVAAAAGAGLDVSRPEGRAVLDAGAGRMSASLVARGRVVLAKGLSYGFDRMNEDIVQLVRAETGLRIGFQAAEELKLVLGSALPAREVTATAVGLDMKTGFPGEREISAVQMRQSPKPSGAKSGAMTPESAASRLCCESATTLRRRSNVCKNQMTMVATKMTVKARWRKSFAFSQRSWATFLAPGRR